MHPKTLALTFFPTTVLAWGTGPPSSKDAILLSNVQQLILHGGGALTAHRRVSAAPQLSCLSSRALCRLAGEMDVMKCTNTGKGYHSEDIQWACEASLPATVRLTSTQVICEGYRSAEDDYVLRGSCGVEYRLALTEQGAAKHPNLEKEQQAAGDGEGASDRAGLFIFFAVVALMFALAWCSSRRDANQRRRPDHPHPDHHRRPGLGHDYDPPPPYFSEDTDPRPWGQDDGAGGGSKKSRSSRSNSSNSNNNSSSSRNNVNNGPGFRTGLAAGAAAGAAAGYTAARAGGWLGNHSSADANSASRQNFHESQTRTASESPTENISSTGFGGTSRR